MLINLIKDGRLSFESIRKILKSYYKTWNYKTSSFYKSFTYKRICNNILFKFLNINIQSINITRRVGKNFMRLSGDSAFSILGIGSKIKKRNWRKNFYYMFYRSWAFITSINGPRKLLEYSCRLRSKRKRSKRRNVVLKLLRYTCLQYSLFRIYFYLQKRKLSIISK